MAGDDVPHRNAVDSSCGESSKLKLEGEGQSGPIGPKQKCKLRDVRRE
jgi:hypothetical protein